jgi:predicted naringenin-chalcone synthase
MAREGEKVIFAIHPGGPKIVDAVQRVLELSDAQVASSRDVLRRFGNMSSATLPHVWMQIASSADIPSASIVVSLAFGPGLTMCGAVMVKT